MTRPASTRTTPTPQGLARSIAIPVSRGFQRLPGPGEAPSQTAFLLPVGVLSKSVEDYRRPLATHGIRTSAPRALIAVPRFGHSPEKCPGARGAGKGRPRYPPPDRG